jgi:hypothetical protein
MLQQPPLVPQLDDPATCGFGVGARGPMPLAQLAAASADIGFGPAAVAGGLVRDPAQQEQGQQQQQQQEQRQQGTQRQTCAKGGIASAIRPFPQLQSLPTLLKLWALYDQGAAGQPALKALEASTEDPKHTWRRGADMRKRWHEIKQFVAAVQQRAAAGSGRQLMTAEQVVRYECCCCASVP